MAFVLGKDCKLYRNTGSFGTPAWNEIPNVKDLAKNFETSEADVTTRGNNGWEATVPALTLLETEGDKLIQTALDKAMNVKTVQTGSPTGD
jgi:hypothetical protein